MSVPLDLHGQMFGLLTVVQKAHAPGRSKWVCLCACGQMAVVMTENLRGGVTRSCGCLRGIRNTARSRVHGEADKTREYTAWLNAKGRCRPSHPQAKGYFYRGISMCERWRRSYSAFLADMGRCPDRFTLDRIDNDRGYQPDNCRWADRVTQARNRRPRNGAAA